MKHVFAFMIFIVASSSLIAQNPAFITGGLSVLGGRDQTSEEATILPSLTLMPGIKFFDKGDFCLLVAAPISIGVSDNDGDYYLGMDLPLTLNMNVGYGFTDHSHNRAGFFAGGGLAYHNSYNESYDWNGLVTTNHLRFTGYLIQTGVTFRHKKNKREGMMIRLSWLSQYPDHKKNVLGLGLIACLE